MTTENQLAEAAGTTEAVGGAQAAQAAPAPATAPSPDKPVTDFPWMRVPTQRGMKPTPGPQGLRLEDVDTGSYGDVPDVWPYTNDTPRGSHPAPVLGLPASYTIFNKYEVWSDNVRVLYEDAIRDRWSSATDVPWETLQPLPDHIEHAICQICTEMSEQAYVSVQVFSGWLEEISYGFHEVKNYLATQIFDSARHVEAFRKRALANGGGLGIESPGIFHRASSTSMKFTELVVTNNIVRAVFNMVVLDALKSTATSEAERVLYSNIQRDTQRHIDYGVGHLTFFLQRQPQMYDTVGLWLGRAEGLLVIDQRRDAAFNESLILLLGTNAADGREKLTELRRTFVAAYLNRLADARVYDRLPRLATELKAFVPEGLEVPTTVSMRPLVADPALT